MATCYRPAHFLHTAHKWPATTYGPSRRSSGPSRLKPPMPITSPLFMIWGPAASACSSICPRTLPSRSLRLPLPNHPSASPYANRRIGKAPRGATHRSARRRAAMADEAKNLETARADRSVWLMKCPTVVSRAWQEAAAASASSNAASASPVPNLNPVVAKVVLSLDPLRPEEQPLQFKMEMAQTDNGNTPKSFSLNMFKDFVPMCVFSESNQGKLACEGKVEHKFDMEPHSDNLVNYGKLCRERTKQSMVKNRKLMVYENDNGMSMRPMPGRPVTSSQKEKKKPIPVKPSDMKRTRRDRGELENILFKLFERQPNWSLKHLMQETDQPEQFLKEILNDLCFYNKRGPNQGTHELKPEYKKSTEDADAT